MEERQPPDQQSDAAQTPTLDEQQPANFPLDESPAPILPTQTDAGTTRALAAFLTISPFLDLHERAGEPDQHRARRVLCFSLDLLVRAAAIALLFGLIFAVAWKVLAPLPPIDQPLGS